MTDLLDLIAQAPAKQPRHMARRTDPPTSLEAAQAILPQLKALQRTVYGHLLRAKSGGLTDLDLETLCDNHGSTFRTRRSELVGLGLVCDSGRRELQRRHRRVIWVATLYYIPPGPAP